MSSYLIVRCFPSCATPLPLFVFFGYFLGRVLSFGVGPLPDHGSPTYGLLCCCDLQHEAPFPGVFEMGVSLTFCLDWPQTQILSISASQVAGLQV
jgi:hypothetical protein